jgi:hypothetical protein
MVWFGEDAINAWNAPPSGRPGGQRRYSDLAIVTALTLRTVFHLALRQTEGFVASLIRLMGLTLKTPDHTTLSRRNRSVEVPRLARVHDGPVHLVIDSTGLKMLGDPLLATDANHLFHQRPRRHRPDLVASGDADQTTSTLPSAGASRSGAPFQPALSTHAMFQIADAAEKGHPSRRLRHET